MTDTIIHQGPGYTIAITDEPSTFTGYGSIVHPDGTINHGFVDLRDHPELAESIPEVARSPGLASILKAVNSVGSPLFSIGCECHEFELDQPREDGSKIHVGGFVDISLRDSEKAADQSRLIALAEWTLSGIGAPAGGEAISYELIIEPLKAHFGKTGCFAVMMKPHGYGNTPQEAWRAFDVAANGLANSLARAIPQASEQLAQPE